MAGCFGNSMFDRDMERQLFNHLDNEAQWDNFCEKVSNCFHPKMWDDGLDIYFDGKDAQKILSEGFKDDLSIEAIAESIAESYTDYLKSQHESKH